MQRKNIWMIVLLCSLILRDFDHCPAKATVNIYKSNEPERLFIPNNLKIGYIDPRINLDPSDMDIDNPWQKSMIIEMSMGRV